MELEKGRFAIATLESMAEDPQESKKYVYFIIFQYLNIIILSVIVSKLIYLILLTAHKENICNE